MSYYGILGNRIYNFNTVEDYLLGLEIMEDLQEIFEERMGYCDVVFEFNNTPVELKVEKTT